jgi:hypothetical protein
MGAEDAERYSSRMAESLADNIRENAAGPKKAQGDGISVEQHPIADQIAAEKFLQSQQAVTTRTRGLRFGRFAPPGAGEHG